MNRRITFSRGWLILLAGLAAVAALGLPPRRVSAAVTISSIAVTMQGDQVLVSWTTATELNNLGFNVLRGDSAEGPFTALSSAYPMITAHCPGATTCDNPDYTYVDTTISPNQAYWYLLQSVSLSLVEENHTPALCATSGTALCVQPDPATATPTATTVPPSATPTATATARPSQGNLVTADAATPTATQAPTSEAAGESNPGAAEQLGGAASATADAQLSRVAETQGAAQPGQQQVEDPGEGQSALVEVAELDEPVEAVEPPAEEEAPPLFATATGQTVADSGGGLSQFTFPTATLAASATATAAGEQGGPQNQPVEQAGSAADGAGDLPAGIGWAAALTALALALLALPAAGYFLRQHLRR
jgi:hypothetical protein